MELCHRDRSIVSCSVRQDVLNVARTNGFRIGDVVDGLLAAWVFLTCYSVLKGQDCNGVVIRMISNICIDFGIGLVPIIGDIADGVYKCNTRNAALLEKVLTRRGEKRRKAAHAAPLQDERGDSGRDGHQHQLRDDEYNNASYDGPPPRYTSTRSKNPRAPPMVHAAPETRGGRGWFGRGRDADLEAGEELPPMQPPRHGNSRSLRDDRRH